MQAITSKPGARENLKSLPLAELQTELEASSAGLNKEEVQRRLNTVTTRFLKRKSIRS